MEKEAQIESRRVSIGMKVKSVQAVETARRLQEAADVLQRPSIMTDSRRLAFSELKAELIRTKKLADRIQ